jgi:CheY-like chemotaxis protein/predicted  nucleic acid-binding Zn-ribbon protein
MSEILLIDAEQPFANTMKSALEGRGFKVKQLDDGKDGLEYAREAAPALIVLCVELPKMSGYSICNKLKKDDDLKSIPLLITSSEATPETFAQHRKLKTRAEDYLIKPFDAASLIEKIGELIPLPEGGQAAESLVEEESLSLDSFDALDGLEESPPSEVALSSDELESIQLPADDGENADLSLDDLGNLDDLGADLGGSDLAGEAAAAADDLGALDDLGGDLSFDNLEEESVGAATIGDDALDALDSAFDGIGTPGESTDPESDSPPPPPPPAARPSPSPSLSSSSSTSAADLEALSGLRRENTDLLAKVGELEARLRSAEESARAAQAALNDKSSSSTSSARDTLELKKEVRAKEKELMDLKDELLKKDEVVVELEERVSAVQRESQAAIDNASMKEAEIASLQARVKAVSDERDQLEAAVRDTRANAEQEAAGLRSHVENMEAELASARGDIDSVRADLERTKKDLERSQNEANRALADGARMRSELDEQKGRVGALEKDIKEGKDQLVDAYNRIKAEERVREKAKKAVEIAFSLLQGEVDTRGNDEGMELAELDA